MARSLLRATNFWLDDQVEYELKTQIGEGRFATVWKAQEDITDKILAVKVFRKSDVPEHEINLRVAEKFEEQVLLAAQGGPHILAIGNIRYVKDGRRKVELPMDFYEHNLYHLMANSKQSRGLLEGHIAVPKWYDTVLFQMLEALQYLHNMHVPIVHRDIKPQNILYTTITHFVLADFGNARPVEGGLNEDNDCFEYMAPEFYNGCKQTTAVDIWSLGVLCLDILLLVPTVPQEYRTIELLKERSWCNSMHEFARHCNKPEVEMMVRMKRGDRATATALLKFLKDNPATRTRRISATEEVVYLIFYELERFNNPSKEKIRQMARTYVQTMGASPAKADATESTPKNKDDLVARRKQIESGMSPLDKPASLAAKLFTLGRSGQGSEATSPVAGHQNTTSPHKKLVKQSTTGAPARTSRSAGASAEPSPPARQGCVVSSSPLPPDLQREMEALGLATIAGPSNSGDTTLQTALQTMLGQPAQITTRSPGRSQGAAGSSGSSGSGQAQSLGGYVPTQDQVYVEGLGSYDLGGASSSNPRRSSSRLGRTVVGSMESRSPAGSSTPTARMLQARGAAPPAEVTTFDGGVILELDTVLMDEISELERLCMMEASLLAGPLESARSCGASQASESITKEKAKGPRGTVGPSKSRRKKQSRKGAQGKTEFSTSSPKQSIEDLEEELGGPSSSTPPPPQKKLGGQTERGGSVERQGSHRIEKQESLGSSRSRTSSASATESVTEAASEKQIRGKPAISGVEQAAAAVRAAEAAEAARNEQRDEARRKRQAQATQAATKQQPRPIEKGNSGPGQASKQKQSSPLPKAATWGKQQKIFPKRDAGSGQIAEQKRLSPAQRIPAGDKRQHSAGGLEAAGMSQGGGASQSASAAQSFRPPPQAISGSEALDTAQGIRAPPAVKRPQAASALMMSSATSAASASQGIKAPQIARAPPTASGSQVADTLRGVGAPQAVSGTESVSRPQSVRALQVVKSSPAGSQPAITRAPPAASASQAAMAATPTKVPVAASVVEPTTAPPSSRVPQTTKASQAASSPQPAKPPQPVKSAQIAKPTQTGKPTEAVNPAQIAKPSQITKTQQVSSVTSTPASAQDPFSSAQVERAAAISNNDPSRSTERLQSTSSSSNLASSSRGSSEKPASSPPTPKSAMNPARALSSNAPPWNPLTNSWARQKTESPRPQPASSSQSTQSVPHVPLVRRPEVQGQKADTQARKTPTRSAEASAERASSPSQKPPPHLAIPLAERADPHSRKASPRAAESSDPPDRKSSPRSTEPQSGKADPQLQTSSPRPTKPEVAARGTASQGKTGSPPSSETGGNRPLARDVNQGISGSGGSGGGGDGEGGWQQPKRRTRRASNPQEPSSQSSLSRSPPAATASKAYRPQDKDDSPARGVSAGSGSGNGSSSLRERPPIPTLNQRWDGHDEEDIPPGRLPPRRQLLSFAARPGPALRPPLPPPTPPRASDLPNALAAWAQARLSPTTSDAGAHAQQGEQQQEEREGQPVSPTWTPTHRGNRAGKARKRGSWNGRGPVGDL